MRRGSLQKTTPSGFEHQTQQIVVQLLDIHRQIVNFLHPGPGATGLDYRQELAVLKVNIGKQIAAAVGCHSIVDVFASRKSKDQ